MNGRSGETTEVYRVLPESSRDKGRPQLGHMHLKSSGGIIQPRAHYLMFYKARCVGGLSRAFTSIRRRRSIPTKELPASQELGFR